MTYAPQILLKKGQIPAPPARGQSWSDVLRWLIAVMDPDDRDLAIVASLLCFYAQNGALTKTQDARARLIAGRIIAWHQVGALQCQRANLDDGDACGFGGNA